MVTLEDFGGVEGASGMMFLLYLIAEINELNHHGLVSVILLGLCATHCAKQYPRMSLADKEHRIKTLKPG